MTNNLRDQNNGLLENKAKTVVCVTDQRNCDRIIKSASVIAGLTGTELAVINIGNPSRLQDPDSIEYLFNVTAQYGGEMTVLYHNEPARAIINYIKANKVANLVTGLPEGPNSVLHRLWSKFTHIHCFTVDKGGELTEIPNPVKAAREIERYLSVDTAKVAIQIQ